jgi:hypothetical protein
MSDSTRPVIGATERDVDRLTLSSLDQSGLALIASLAAYWDTLAWADFHAGDVAAAEQYMRPAWDLAQQGVFAAHLAEMLLADGDRQRAADYFARAIALDRPEASAAGKLLALVDDEASRNGLVRRARADSVREASSSVPRIPGVTGHAQVFVRIGQNGNVDDVRFVAGDEALRPEAEMIRTVTLPSRLPPSSTVHVIRRGSLACDDSAGSCALTLISVFQVRSTN